MPVVHSTENRSTRAGRRLLAPFLLLRDACRHEGVQLTFSSRENPKITEACLRVMVSLCGRRRGACTYADELDKMVLSSKEREKWVSGSHLLSIACKQLEASAILIDGSGRLRNMKQLEPELAAVLKFIRGVAQVRVLVDKRQLENGDFPLSSRYKEKVGELLGNGTGEAVMIILVKIPPESIRSEILRITDEKMGGVTLWLSKWHSEKYAKLMSSELASYLKHSTIEVLHTGKTCELYGVEKLLNDALEGKGKAEKHHVSWVAQSIGKNHKSESIKNMLKLSGFVFLAVKFLEHAGSKFLNTFGGTLGDVADLILFDAPQSARADGGFFQRLGSVKKVIFSGIFGLMVSIGLGALSTLIYDDAAPLLVRVAGTLVFGLACCSSAIGTIIGAASKVHREIVAQEPGMGRWKTLVHAYREALLNSPFRIGHTLIGIPIQLALSALSGVYKFFSDPMFVFVETLVDDALGILSAYIYPKIAEWNHLRKLRRL